MRSTGRTAGAGLKFVVARNGLVAFFLRIFHIQVGENSMSKCTDNFQVRGLFLEFFLIVMSRGFPIKFLLLLHTFFTKMMQFREEAKKQLMYTKFTVFSIEAAFSFVDTLELMEEIWLLHSFFGYGCNCLHPNLTVYDFVKDVFHCSCNEFNDIIENNSLLCAENSLLRMKTNHEH